MRHSQLNRRQFLGRTVTLTGVALLSNARLPAAGPAAKRTATDQVELGRTGVKLSRLGFGTGSNGGSIQRQLGQDDFTRLIRYAYDQGITYFDTADAYETHGMLRIALKGLPREKLFIQSKMRWNNPTILDKPLEVLNRFRKELDTDYIDSLLIHCVATHNWDDELKKMMDAFSEAKEKKIIRLKGASSHGLPGLTRSTQVDWVDVHLVRVNPQGQHVDGEKGEWAEPGNFPAAMKEIRAMHAKGRGIIGMKIIGNGDFKNPEDREKSIRHAMTCGCLNAVVLGFARAAEVDEAIERMNRALA
jgi:predicted aldo/keto reductase-like oxidoreductase